ncbi:hypothetical protein CLOSTHATH_00186 [Hungatella hathewayi DSM 13479]|uniref:Uncharacterized protein n=1 Tax=Hungatella hathewayi DSM 13479 TaxID=566550 RepID=D3A9B6_9FIRM|nr:hypothetical protein CLOSTHATH_00186 [Hungatella hathewayi DSM 13479]
MSNRIPDCPRSLMIFQWLWFTNTFKTAAGANTGTGFSIVNPV